MKNRLSLSILTACIISLLTVFFTDNQYLHTLDNKIHNLYFRLRGNLERREPPPIVIVFIDELSLAYTGQRSPTPRDFLANVLTKLIEKKPKVIGLDILLDKTYEKASDEMLQEVLQKA